MSTFSTSKIEVTSDIRLELRKYAGGDETPVLCIPGLTRNAADFEDIAPVIAKTNRDVYVVSLRGRGASDRDPVFANYHPFVYRDDMLALLDVVGLKEVIFLGTSLGGLVTMLAHEIAPTRFKAVILNDVGPDLAIEGLNRIAGYVGDNDDKSGTPDIGSAAKKIKSINETAFPDADFEFWQIFALRTFRKTSNGYELDYDPNIAKAFNDPDLPTPDLWPGFRSLENTPTLLIHGEISDLITPAIVEDMRAALPHLKYCRVPNIGHAPTLSEPAAENAILEFLNSL